MQYQTVFKEVRMRMKSFFATLLVAVSLFLSVGNIQIAQASAETALTLDTFTMEEGAAVRLKTLQGENGEAIETNGLRFSAEISQNELTALQNAGARFGVIIVAQDLLKTTEINAETVFGKNPSFYFTNETGGDTSKIAALNVQGAACANIDEDEQIEISGSIVNLKVNNFTRTFVGRVYVAIPTVNAETGETQYTYHFAPYYNGDINNNARCIFYVAQRAIESKKENASTLESKYIIPFKETDRFKNYSYRYYVEHYYLVHDENDEHTVAHVEKVAHYAMLDTQVTAEPIVKPDGVQAIKDYNFIYDLDASLDTQSGLVYAAGMQTLKLYYETAGTISEEHKKDSLEALVADFLNVDKASENFGLHISGYEEDWQADAVYDPNYPETQIGISLTAVQNASKNRHLLLSQHFFEHLRAFGVESVSFDFHTAEQSGKAMKCYFYQEEDEDLPLPVYDAETGRKLTDGGGQVTVERVKLYLADITPGGGVLIEVHQSSSSNKGIYHFGNIEFTFPTTNTELS